MGNCRGIILLVCILSVLSLALTVYERGATSNRGHEKARAFQEFACGFGLGASVNAKWGFIDFDPRIDNADETVLSPVPGGYSFSPERGFTLTHMSEMPVAHHKETGQEVLK